MSQQPSTPDDVWLTRKEAATWLTKRGCPVTEGTLRKYASNDNAGGGPPFFRTGWKAVRYTVSDLERWRREHMVRVE